MNLAELTIGNITPDNENTDEISADYLLLPGEFCGLHRKPIQYFITVFVKTPDALKQNPLPSFNDSDGNVTLFIDDNSGRIIIDEFDYAEELQPPICLMM